MWVGSSDAVTPIFEADRIPNYATESDAVRGFMHLVRYREALEALMATPPSLPQDFKPDVAVAQRGRRTGGAGRTRLARPDRGDAPARGLFHSGRARAARPQCRGSRRRRGAAAGRGIDRRGEDPVAGHRAQVRGRRRAAQSRPAKTRCARRSPISSRGRGPRDPTLASPASRFIR